MPATSLRWAPAEFWPNHSGESARPFLRRGVSFLVMNNVDDAGNNLDRMLPFFQRQAGRGELGGIQLDADRRMLLAADHDLGAPVDLRDLSRLLLCADFGASL